jgi:type IV pilus assembly protein PilA
VIANENISSSSPKHSAKLRFVSRRIYGIFDLAITIMILGILIGLSAGTYDAYIMRAHVGTALVNASMLKEELAEHYYLTGEWSSADPGIFDFSYRGEEVEFITYVKGGLTFSLEHNGTHHLLSFRAALPERNPRSPMLWLCGYDEVPTGYHAVAKNRTNIPLEYLPAECKG